MTSIEEEIKKQVVEYKELREKYKTIPSSMKDKAAGVRWKVCDLSPFMGSVIFKLNLKVELTPYGTGATDGRSIYVDPRALETWNRDALLFLFAHEVWHAAMGHCERLGSRNPKIWNIVTDHVINTALTKMPKFGALPKGPDGKEIGIMLDHSEFPAGDTPESLYTIYLQKIQQCEEHGDGQGQGNGGGGQSGDEGDGDDDGDCNGQHGSGGQSGGGKGKKCTCPRDHKGRPIDTDDYDGGGLGRDVFDPPEDMSEEEQEQWAREKEGELQRAVQDAMNRGLLPAGFDELVGIGKAQVNWREIIQRFVNNAVFGRMDYSMRTYNQNLLQSKLYAPKLNTPSSHLIMVVDTSGSVSSDDLSKFVGEVFAATQAGAKITLIHCDAKVNKVDVFEPGAQPPDGDSFQIGGRGGTCFAPALEYIRDEIYDEYDAVVYFTDGYGDDPDTDLIPRSPMLWLNTSKHMSCSWANPVIPYDTNL